MARPQHLDIEINADNIIKEEEDEGGVEEEEMNQMIRIGSSEEMEGQTPGTECTVLSCVSRGTSCTPADIGREMQVSCQLVNTHSV